MKLVKAIVIARDRVSYTQQCVRALMLSPGVGDIHVIDHGSTYPPMLDWLSLQRGSMSTVDSKGCHLLMHFRENAHPRDLWTNGTLESIVDADERFIVTDCDVVAPSADWRGRDWVEVLHKLLDAAPWAVKAGLGLHSDPLPPQFLNRALVTTHERNYRQCMCRLVPDVYAHAGPCSIEHLGHRASVDTTLALYRRLEPFAIDPSIRTSHPHHAALHLSWLEDTEHPTEEQQWYREHAMPGVSHWLDPFAYEGEHGLPERTTP